MGLELSEAVVEVLADRFGVLTYAGSGAWSTAFKFSRRGADFVVRVGAQMSDFTVDAEMAAYSSTSLPIPFVVEIDQLDAPHDHLFICVSTFAPGRALERCNPTEWTELVPVIADLLGAMHRVSAPTTPLTRRWPQTLLTQSDGNGRLAGWQERLANRPQQWAAYCRAIERLEELCKLPQITAVPLSLLHCDLINGNVHIDSGSITGVFDWGCRRWGDHLYDLAWFEFWDPWMENLDAELLQRELSNRWGQAPDPDRFAACLLHIGADHLVYNAVKGDLEDGLALVDRLTELDLL